jgi:hypothetical protein
VHDERLSRAIVVGLARSWSDQDTRRAIGQAFDGDDIDALLEYVLLMKEEVLSYVDD